MALGRVPANINIIGKVQESTKHLGVCLSLNHDTAYKKNVLFLNHVFQHFESLYDNNTNRLQVIHANIGKFNLENFALTVGVGQSDSSSSAKYIILHTLYTKIFESPKLAHLLFTLDNGTKLLPLTFADDTFLALEITSENDVKLLHEAFQKIGNLTGLFINPSKTAILCPEGAYGPSNIELIGKIKTSAQLLGLSLSTGYDSTYTTALRKMEKKSNSIFFRYKDNLLKRKLVVCTMLASCMYHIYPVYLPRPPEIKKNIEDHLKIPVGVANNA